VECVNLLRFSRLADLRRPVPSFFILRLRAPSPVQRALGLQPRTPCMGRDCRISFGALSSVLGTLRSSGFFGRCHRFRSRSPSTSLEGSILSPPESRQAPDIFELFEDLGFWFPFVGIALHPQTVSTRNSRKWDRGLNEFFFFLSRFSPLLWYRRIARFP